MVTQQTWWRTAGGSLLWPCGLSLLFIATRFVNYLLWQLPAVKFVENDISYYGWAMWCLLDGGISSGDAGCLAAVNSFGVLGEYPVPAVWLLQGIYLLGGGYSSWAGCFMVAMILLDAVVAILLFRRDNPWGSLFWILFIGACGPIVWFRFDLVTAALVALACLWISRHPVVAGALIGVGAALKLWPALFALPLAAPNPLRPGKGRRRLVGFLAAGFGLGLSSLLVSGWARSIAPLQWQALRGLQQESVPATPLVLLRTITQNPPWTLELSEFKAIEIFGPGVDSLLMLSTVLTGLALLLTVGLSWRLYRRYRHEAPRLQEAMILVIFAILLANLVANKTLSTQYVQWLAGPIAALLVVRRSQWLTRPLHLIVGCLLLIAGLTQYTYPWGTFGIMQIPNAAGFEASTLILRNLLLVLLLGYSTTLAWRATKPPIKADAATVPTRLGIANDSSKF